MVESEFRDISSFFWEIDSVDEQINGKLSSFPRINRSNIHLKVDNLHKNIWGLQISGVTLPTQIM